MPGEGREPEGVIKFDLQFTPGLPLQRDEIAELIDWRGRLYRLRLIGQDPARYGGIGFGNLSRRLPGPACRLAVTGSQTGMLAELDERHFSIVTGFDLHAHSLSAEGPIAPSSETLTHARVYALRDEANYVFHVHSPDIWRAAGRLSIPATAPGAAYGSPEMAAEVERLLRTTDAGARHLFVMSGHEDGVVSFGATAGVAGTALLLALAAVLSP